MFEKKLSVEKENEVRIEQASKDKRFYEARVHKMNDDHLSDISKIHSSYRRIIDSVKKEKEEENKQQVKKAIKVYKMAILKRDAKIKDLNESQKELKAENNNLLNIYDKYTKLRESLLVMSKTADMSVSVLKELVPQIIAEFGRLGDKADIHLDVVKKLAKEFEEMERKQIEGEEFFHSSELRLVKESEG